MTSETNNEINYAELDVALEAHNTSGNAGKPQDTVKKLTKDVDNWAKSKSTKNGKVNIVYDSRDER